MNTPPQAPAHPSAGGVPPVGGIGPHSGDWFHLDSAEKAGSEPDTQTLLQSLPLTPDHRPPEIPGYTLREEIGRGGMSVAYLATDNRLKRRVAIKVMLDRHLARTEDRARFQAEAETLARLQHPNITQVFEVGVHEGLAYCVLEFAAGGSLDRFLRGRPQLPRLAALTSIVLADAIHAAHQQGIVHRDLKPSNVLVNAVHAGPTATGSSTQSLERVKIPEGLKISDFGLAKRLDLESGLTKTGMILGTPNYMPPEQAAGRSDLAGPLSDVYSLGAMLYEMLTGRPPFAGPTAVETIMLVQAAEPIPPRFLQPGVPRDLETICLKALGKAPVERYGSAADFAADLRRHLEGRPIFARPASRWERLERWCRRNPLVAGLSAALVLTLLAALGVVTTLYLLANQRRHDAEVAQANAESARQKVELAQRQERANAERLEAFKTFMQEDFFKQANFNELGPEATMKAALLKAAGSIGKRFAGQPDLEAFVRDQVGHRLYVMSLFKEAEAEQRRALQLYLQTLGPDHLDTLNVRSNLVNTLIAQSRYDEAEKLLRALLADWERLHGHDNAHTATTLGMLATLLQRRGRLAEAEENFQRAWRTMAKLKGAGDENTLVLLNNLAGVQVERSNFVDAERNYRAALEGFRALKGSEDLTVMGMTYNLGHLLLNLGRPHDALPLLEQTAKAFRARLGDNTAETLIVLNGYAGCLQELGRGAEAEPLLRLVLAKRIEMLGPRHDATLRARHNLAGLLDDQGKLAEAEAIYREVLADTIKQLGADHPDSLATEYILARNWARQGRWSEAEAALASLLDRQRRIHGEHHVRTHTTWLLLVDCLLKEQKHAEAERRVRELLAVWEKKPPSQPHFVPMGRSVLGQALLNQGKLAEAEALLLPAAAALLADERAPLVQKWDAVDRAIAVSQKLNKPDQAAAWTQKRDALPPLPPTQQHRPPSPRS